MSLMTAMFSTWKNGRLSREKLAALQGRATDNHLGLANIVNRLRLIYGKNVGIRVDTDQPGETAVYIDIPQEFETERRTP